MNTQQKIISKNRTSINKDTKIVKDALRNDFPVNEMLFDFLIPEGKNIIRTKGRFKGGKGSFEFVINKKDGSFKQIS